MDGVDYSNFMTAFRDMARDIEKIVERLDKLIELQDARGQISIERRFDGIPESGKVCPVCQGSGYVKNPDPSSTAATIFCQACGGMG